MIERKIFIRLQHICCGCLMESERGWMQCIHETRRRGQLEWAMA